MENSIHCTSGVFHIIQAVHLKCAVLFLLYLWEDLQVGGEGIASNSYIYCCLACSALFVCHI